MQLECLELTSFLFLKHTYQPLLHPNSGRTQFPSFNKCAPLEDILESLWQTLLHIFDMVLGQQICKDKDNIFRRDLTTSTSQFLCLCLYYSLSQPPCFPYRSFFSFSSECVRFPSLDSLWSFYGLILPWIREVDIDQVVPCQPKGQS